MRPLKAVIDPDAIEHNLAQAKRLSGHAKIAAAVKANAYGHGIEHALPSLGRADWLAVASIDEAFELRAHGSSHPILLLEGVFEASEYALCQQHGFEPAIHHPSQLDMLIAGRLTAPIPIWLKLDSGMGRLGLQDKAFEAVFAKLTDHGSLVRSVTLMTHFASADEKSTQSTQSQWQNFSDMTAGLTNLRTAANSAGIMFHPHTHADIVRPGLMLYGAGPDCERNGRALGLRPAMQLETRIIALRQVQAGDGVGYGGSWIAKRPSLIATAAVGYGDGYPRSLSNRGFVSINGQRAPLAGRVSMDMIGIDVTDIQPNIGDPVILWGDGLPIEEVADAAGTIAYELMAAILPRVKRLSRSKK